MANTITIDEFVDKYNQTLTTTDQYSCVEDVIKTKYIDYEEKDFWAKKIVEGSGYKLGSDTNDLANVEISRSRQWFLTKLTFVQAYTNLAFTDNATGNETLREFNLLEKYGLIDEIIDHIPEREIETFKELIDFAENDFRDKIMRPQAYIDAIVEKLRGALGSLGGSLKEMIPSIAKIADHLNSEDLDKILNLIGDIFT